MSENARNVLGEALVPCSYDPLTGYYRDGCCNTDDHDQGSHVVCAKVTQEFLDFSLARGNDLITPRREHRFAGLKAGDRWCLCAMRWKEAFDAGLPPPVVLESTHQRALEAGDTEAGCTVHEVTAVLDDGPLLGQAQVPVLPGDTADSLAARVLVQEHRLYPAVLRRYAAGDRTPILLP